jgi:hypothetical protein
MAEDFPSGIALGGYPFKVGIMPTEDGDKVVLVLRAGQEDQMIYWLDTSDAKNLAEALIVTACRIEDEGTGQPPLKN